MQKYEKGNKNGQNYPKLMQMYAIYIMLTGFLGK